jgi:hypothetical protein
MTTNRKNVNFTCEKNKFKTEKGYTQQYAGLYFVRLTMLRPTVIQHAKHIWNKYNGKIIKQH